MLFRVVDYNARSFRSGIDRAVEAVGGRPDLVLVQECGSRAAVRRFARSLELQSVSSHRLFRRVHNAVLHPPAWRVAGVEVVDFQRTGRTALRGFIAVRLRTGGLTMTAVATHLGLAPGERERHARELTDWVAGQHGPLIVGADLNESPDGGAAQWIGQRLYDGFAVGGRGPGNTFPAKAPSARIDYVFVGQGIDVVRCWVEDTDAASRASDHRPVAIELEVPEG